jgi:predicted ATPase
MPRITLRAENFRALRRLEWSPEGVCLLAGPNGSGKSTVLDALTFLRGLFLHDHEAAFNSISGTYVRRLGTTEDDPVTLEVEVGDIRWRLRFPMSPVGLRGTYGEELFHGNERVLHADMFDEGWYLGDERRPHDRRCCARVLLDMGQSEWMKPLENALANMRVHKSYDLPWVKESGVVKGVDSTLHGAGKNLWSVLSGWKQAPIRHGRKFEWVLQETRRAFPDGLGALEFDRGLPFLFRPGDTDPADGLPPERAADGLLTGLLHLTAVAGAADGSLIAFDELENQLHPHAIRSILAAMRKQAEERDLTILLTMHSPVAMNEFKGHEDQFYVLRQDSPDPVPCALDELYDPDWLAHFVLGDLYEREEIAAPSASSEPER